MKCTKILLSLLLVTALLLCAGCKNTPDEQPSTEPSTTATAAPTEETTAPTEDNAAPYQMGDTMRDFTVTTFDGKTVTLSEVLRGKGHGAHQHLGFLVRPLRCGVPLPGRGL